MGFWAKVIRSVKSFPAPSTIVSGVGASGTVGQSGGVRMSLQERKALLRKQVSQKIAALSPAEIEEQSQSITKHVLHTKDYQNAKAISVFLAMAGREISTHEIVSDAFKQGKKVFVPYIYKRPEEKHKAMDMLELRDQEDLEELKPDAWGIPSLNKDSISQRRNALGGSGLSDKGGQQQKGSLELDLIFMPAVAFDRNHQRLGHGKGFYDHYLQRCHNHAGKMPALIGLALKPQILPSSELVPTNEDDWKVDAIITSDGQI